MEQKTILLVDDADFISTLLKARLERENIRVEQAFNGEEALKFTSENKVDLIILDLIMPKMTGFEFLEKAALDPRLMQVPVIILSNLSQDSDVEKVQRFGVKQYFVKAKVSLDEVVKATQNTLGFMATDSLTANQAL